MVLIIGTKLHCHFLRIFCFSFKKWEAMVIFIVVSMASGGYDFCGGGCTGDVITRSMIIVVVPITLSLIVGWNMVCLIVGWNMANQIMWVESLMVLHNHNLLLHLGIQLLVMVLVMHSILSVASSFSNFAPHFPLLLLHLPTQVVLHVWPIPLHPGSLTLAPTNIYLVYYASLICILLNTIMFSLMILLSLSFGRCSSSH